MANSAARARLRFGDSNCLGNSGRTRIKQNRKGPGMKILPRPGDVLAALFAGSAVAAGRFAAYGANERRSILATLTNFFSRSSGNSAKDKNSKHQSTRSSHVLSLTSVVKKFPS